MKSIFSQRNTRWLIAAILLGVGVMYFVLLIPIFIPGVNIIGVSNPTLAPNRFLSVFEMFWQPVCGTLYIFAGVKIFAKNSADRRTFANLALFSSFIEALVLNIYLLIATRVSQPFIDGIFTSSSKYSFFTAIVFIGLPFIGIAFINRFLSDESTTPAKK